MDRTELLFGCRGAQRRALIIRQCLGLFVLFLVTGALAPAQAAERLFASPTGRLRAQAAPIEQPAPGYLRTKQVQINTAMLAPSSPVRRAAFRAAADQRSFVLNLFADKELEVLIERTVAKGTATFTSFGKVVGQPESQVILAVADGVMAGSVFVPGNNTVQISYAGNGYHMVGELDPEQIPP